MVDKKMFWALTATMILLTIHAATAQINELSQNYVTGKINFDTYINDANEWTTAQYTFTYPADKTSGYYVVDKKYCTATHCDECAGTGTCQGITSSLYTIKPGYAETYAYSSNLPVYGAWQIKDFTDFRNKCFVGDCNHANLRHTVCVNSDKTLTVQTTSCDKWTDLYGTQITSFCVNGKRYYLGEQYNAVSSTCTKPKTINFYYIYNDYEGYEGYDSSWQTRWQQRLEETNQALAQYNIRLTPSFYEYRLSDNSAIPGAIYAYVNSPSNPYWREGDVHVTIIAGNQHPSNYGYSCTGDTPENPCSAHSGIRLPDYYYFNQDDVLIHELGHKMGCPHTGQIGSLSAHQYVGDIMSYGASDHIFKYECRIALWELGQNA